MKKKKLTLEYMRGELEKRYGRPLTCDCLSCIRAAFEDERGLVSDDELIAASKGKLRHV